MVMAYINRPGSVARLRGGCLEIEHREERIASWPLIHVDAVICVGRVAITSPALAELAARRIPVGFVGRYGGFAGMLSPATRGTIDARLGQHDVLRDPERRLRASRRIVASRIRSLRQVAEAWFRSAPDVADRAHIDRLTRLEHDVAEADTRPTLLGIEGSATAAHFAVLRRANRSRLPFHGRSTRPPRDEINAALSLGYTILVREIWSVLETLGLDPHVGILHECVPNRPALALDVVEPFRAIVIDRAVIKAANTGRLRPTDFTRDEDEGYRLTDDARGRFLGLIEGELTSPCPKWLADPDGPAEETIRERVHRRCRTVFEWFRRSPAPGTPADDEPPLPFELHVAESSDLLEHEDVA